MLKYCRNHPARAIFVIIIDILFENNQNVQHRMHTTQTCQFGIYALHLSEKSLYIVHTNNISEKGRRLRLGSIYFWSVKHDITEQFIAQMQLVHLIQIL
jgi:hypothetical protein